MAIEMMLRQDVCSLTHLSGGQALQDGLLLFCPHLQRQLLQLTQQFQLVCLQRERTGLVVLSASKHAHDYTASFVMNSLERIDVE